MQTAKNYAASGKNMVEKMVGRDTSDKTAPQGQNPKPSRNIANNASQRVESLLDQGQRTQNTANRSTETHRGTSGAETTIESRNRQPAASTVKEETKVSRERTDVVREDTTINKPSYNEIRHRVNPNVTIRDTQVEELVNPAVVKEKVIPTEKEKTNLEYQRELHQDHYQTRVQPVIDREVLPEQHVHRTLPTEYREHRCNNKDEVERLVEKERSQFQDSRTVLPGEYRREDGHIVAEESRHHHVHEIVQPVLEREVIQPTVIHTTAPIHERIEKDTTFHPKTVQPAMTLEEFNAAGGTLDGRTTVTKQVFQGEPQVLANGGADVKHPASGHRASVASTSTSATTSAANASSSSTTTQQRPATETEYHRETTYTERTPGSFPESSSTERRTSAGSFDQDRCAGSTRPHNAQASQGTNEGEKLGKHTSLKGRVGDAVESAGERMESVGRSISKGTQ